MGWLEVSEQYVDQPRGTQNIEDLVARRVLRGLSINPAKLDSYESRLFGDRPEDRTLWQRTKQILDSMMMRERPITYRTWEIELGEGLSNHKAALDKLSLLEDLMEAPDNYPVLFMRIKNSKTALAYSVWRPENTILLTPPYTALKAIQVASITHHIIVQELEQFIKQFGPFNWGDLCE